MVLTSEKSSKKVNIKLIIEYDGKNYSGWQRQKNPAGKGAGKPTIQQTIEEALQVILRDKQVKITGAGRTDAGVHALGQTANFRIAGELHHGALRSKDLFQKLDLHKLVYRFNSLLPNDITVKKALKAADSFHARYSAKKRVYRYLVAFGKKSYNGEKYFRHKLKFDFKAAGEFCKAIEGIHSFKGFCKNKHDDHNFNCNVFYARVKKKRDNTAEFEICANRFLHSMVRALTGVMLSVASGKTTIKEFKDKFIKGENFRIQFVPANALILAKIIY